MKQPEQIRTPKLMIVLGTNGTGKTTLVKKLVLDDLKRNGHNAKILIVVPDDMEWQTVPFVHPNFPGRIGNYVGARKVIYYDGLLELLHKQFSNGLIVFDDCRSYFTAMTDLPLHNLLIRRRQMMTDFIAVGHGFTEVPPKFFTFSTHLIMFRTLDNIMKRKNELNNFDLMKANQAEINRIAIKDPHYYRIIKTI